MHRLHQLYRTAVLLTFLALISLAGCAQRTHAAAPGALSAGEDATATRDTGTIVDGPSSPFRYQPELEATPVDVETTSLKQVFTDIGAIGRTWYQHVQTLANPYFGGRLPGTRGHDAAADYIEHYFRAAGLEPAFPASDDSSAALSSYRQPFEFTTRRVSAANEDAARVIVPAMNVAGILPGRGALAEQFIIIGAHYDHVGRGEYGASRPEHRGEIHPGADDNASGTAAMLVLAEMLAAHYDASTAADLRSILFLAFDAEELGLHGSRHFVRHSPIPTDRITIVINMDMVGRMRGDNLSVLGVATAEGLRELVTPHFEASGLTVAVTKGGSGASDDANFHRAGVPALHFFTGVHGEYTSPEDEAWTTNPLGARKVVELIERITVDLATRDRQLQYTRAGSGGGRDRGYAGVRLGIRPGMGADLEHGILIDGVSSGTSAEEAGLKAGDIMLAWDDRPLDSMRDLFESLQNHKPGDIVRILVERDGERMTVDVTLKASSGEGSRHGRGGD
jgi:hypothetical protein